MPANHIHLINRAPVVGPVTPIDKMLDSVAVFAVLHIARIIHEPHDIPY